MVNIATPHELIARDLTHVWHPCSQMKDFEISPPLVVHQAKDSLLYTNKGPLIDGISSWWCKSLGHGNPEVMEAIINQLQQFEHVISANTTHPLMVELAEQLSVITQLQHIFFASDGSSAVEIALKLALQAQQLRGRGEKNQYIALKHGYHGETIATLSISDVNQYKAPFQQFGLPCHFLQHIPYVFIDETPTKSQQEQAWQQTRYQLEVLKEKACAIIVEPLLQGAGGMRVYSAEFLHQLAAWAKANDVYLIADEIMTGLGRTGEWLACHHANIKADMVCLSKGLTSGAIPLSCVMIDHPIYELFYDDYEQEKSFLHSHTFSGHALGISAAVATLKVMQQLSINQQAQHLGNIMREHFIDIAKQSGKLNNLRSLGACVAGDLMPVANRRLGFEFYQEAIKRGAFLRPLGNTVYWLPSLTTKASTISQLADITLEAIQALY